MTGTFSSLGSALSGLRYNQVLMDTAGNNISNASTDGYVRRTVQGGSVSAGAVALWSTYDGHGDGVAVQSVDRTTDALLTSRVRREHASLTYLTTQQTALSRIEDGIGEPGDSGVAAALQTFNASWQALGNNPGDAASRQQVIGDGQSLARAINAQANNITGEEADQRLHLMSNVSDINTAASGLATLNLHILQGEQSGLDVNTLKDQRDQLALKLANLAGGTVSTEANGMYDVTVGGTPLVTGQSAGTLVIDTGITASGASDGNPITFRIDDATGSTPVGGALGGEAGAVTDLLTTTLPDYKAGLDAIAQQLTTAINSVHQSGYDLAGNPGGAFFTYNASDPAGSLAVAITDTSLLAASGIPGGNIDGGNAYTLSTSTTGVKDAYQQLVNGFGTKVAAINQQATNQVTLTDSLDGSWEQQAGVSIDEETVNLVTAQRGYQAAARVMTTIDDMLDTLINHTGLVGR
ncbi:flagellar hook-associated protein FlgK [Nocardioides ultimimeridianus]